MKEKNPSCRDWRKNTFFFFFLGFVRKKFIFKDFYIIVSVIYPYEKVPCCIEPTKPKCLLEVAKPLKVVEETCKTSDSSRKGDPTKDRT